LIKSNDLPLILISPLILLSVGSITIGWLLCTLLFPFPNPIVIPSIIKYLPLIVTIFGLIAIVYILQIKKEIRTLNKTMYNFYQLLIKTYYYDNIINKIIHINALSQTYNNIYLLIDNHLLEYKGPTGIRKFITPIINTSSNYYTGIITKYFYAIIFFSILILSIV
jgi:NADH:ubiquinone oxidoreductase subunit 5 (subunit L)/multisubunit Na+/H+ antiporter MnhA subunit